MNEVLRDDARIPHVADEFDETTLARLATWFSRVAAFHQLEGNEETARHALWASYVVDPHEDRSDAAHHKEGISE